MITVFKTVELSASHVIENHPGKCRRLHGHNYVVTVGITGEVRAATGMVEDFGDVKHAIDAVILTPCDHRHLNDVYPHLHTTAEELAQQWIEDLQKIDPRYKYIRVYETENSYVEIDQR